MIAEQLYFTPVHPQNFGVMQRIAEERFGPDAIPGYDRTVTLFEDVDGMYKLLVAYTSTADPGNIDNLPCFAAVIGPVGDIPDPLARVGSLADVASFCEERFGDKVRHWQSSGGH